MLLAKPLNALYLGEDYAKSVGVNVKLQRTLTIALAALLTSSVTVLAGPIGFIGIAVPYVARMLSQTSDNRILIDSAREKHSGYSAYA